MGMRKYYRAIAKERLKALGVDANKALGTGLLRSFVQKKSKFRKGRKLLTKYRETYQLLWQRVLWGELKKDAWYAQVGKWMNSHGKVRRKAVRAVK